MVGRAGRAVVVAAQVDVDHEQDGQEHERRADAEPEEAAQGEQRVQVVPDRAAQDHQHERQAAVGGDGAKAGRVIRGVGAPRVPRVPAAGGAAAGLEVERVLVEEVELPVVVVGLQGEAGEVPGELVAQERLDVRVQEHQDEAVGADHGGQVVTVEAPGDQDAALQLVALVEDRHAGRLTVVVGLVVRDERTEPDGAAAGQLGEHDRRDGVEHGLDHVGVEAGELRDAVVDLALAEHQLLLELLPGEVGQLGQLGGVLALGRTSVVGTAVGAVGAGATGTGGTGGTGVGTAGTRGVGHDLQPPGEGDLAMLGPFPGMETTRYG